MNTRLRFYVAIGAAFLSTTGLAFADACDDIVNASKPVVAEAANKLASTPEGKLKIELGDIVSVKGERFEKLFDKACANRNIILFLNNWPLTDVTPLPPLDPALGELNFKLVNKRHTDGTDPWQPILGSPGLSGLPVTVSIGLDKGYALPPKGPNLPKLTLTVLPPGWLIAWLVIFAAMVFVFISLARNTTIMRDSAPSTNTMGPYSLSRTQGAVWFFAILAAYLFIGMITGDFSTSINSTALTLMGIGAGTVLGSAVIDAQKDTPAQRNAIQDATTKVTGDIKVAPTDGSVSKDELDSQLKKLRGETEGFFRDIVSDANGVSFHRFQNAVWTFVLAFIFLILVYQNLAMPEFNTTLLGLLGLSAGTYLGLKIPEPVTPTRPAPK